MPSKFYAAYIGAGGALAMHSTSTYAFESDDFTVVANAIAARAAHMDRDITDYAVICRATGEPTPTAEACPDDLSALYKERAAIKAVNGTGADIGANPKQAFGDTKPPLHLVPAALTHAVSVGLSEGRDKYGAWNWRSTKVEAMTYVGAILRHLAAYVDGEDADPDSAIGKSHLAGAAASLAILLDAQEGGFLVDNRPPKGAGGRLMREPVKRVEKK